MTDTTKTSTSAAESSSSAAAKPVNSNPQSTTANNALPTVRGSFQAFDCDKTKKSSAAATAAKVDQGTAPMDSLAKEMTSEPAKLSNVSEKSWIHKAKEGTVSLVDMFKK